MFITMIFFIFIFRGEIKKLKSVSSSACEWLKLNENYYFVICFCKTTFGGKLGLSSQFCVCLSLSLGHLELCFVFFFSAGGWRSLVSQGCQAILFTCLRAFFSFSWLVLVSEKGCASELGRVFFVRFFCLILAQLKCGRRFLRSLSAVILQCLYSLSLSNDSVAKNSKRDQCVRVRVIFSSFL